MADDPYVLRAEGIGKSFGSNEVLKSASLWAGPGKVTTLLGRNGSGKTTLMRIACGSLRADRGRVAFKGRTLPRPRLWRLARCGLMYAPQRGLLSPPYTVGDHFAALQSAFDPDDLRQVIERFEITSLLDRKASTLSGGESVRASLALAFARRPAVLLIDEPLSGLTPRDQEWSGELIRELAGAGSAVVASGHDTRLLLSISDVILWSVAGTTHHLGSPSEARQHHQFRREYLGPGFQ